MRSKPASPPCAIMAEFDTPDAILNAAITTREHGFSHWDVFTPYPVVGMDQAMGLKKSSLGWFSFILGTLGFSLGILMIWWMNSVDYPVLVGGKPIFSAWAAFPTAFEMAILLGAFGALGGMLFLNGLPRLHHPLLKNRRFAMASHDRFFLVIETQDSAYSESDTPRLLESLGSKHIEWIQE